MNEKNINIIVTTLLSLIFLLSMSILFDFFQFILLVIRRISLGVVLAYLILFLFISLDQEEISDVQ